MDERIPMTPLGLRQLKARVDQLRRVELPAATKAVEIARGHGDLSENAEYDIAKDNHAKVLKQINDLEKALVNAQVIDPLSVSTERVVFGTVVRLLDINTSEELSFQIVGIYESDISAGRISVSSPIARGLIGKEVGDEAKVQTPSGTREFEVLEISIHSSNA